MEAATGLLRQAPATCFSGAGFRDNAHAVYYYRAPRCGMKKEIKKKLMLLRSDLQLSGSLAVTDRPQPTLEAADLLLKQLEDLMIQEKQLKQKKKEKAKLKYESKKMDDSDSSESSESSESSDSDCNEVVDMRRHRKKEASQLAESSATILQPQQAVIALPIVPTAEYISPKGSGLKDIQYDMTCVKPNNSFAGDGVSSALVKRIEVCMGGKCKKSGSITLLEEFGKAVGVEGAVVGCKCMGKCRDGPNVRVLGCGEGMQQDSVRTPANPLYIGVGLEDVGAIVADLFGEDHLSLESSPTY